MANNNQIKRRNAANDGWVMVIDGDDLESRIISLEGTDTVEEAPIDGSEYVRKDAGWVAGSGGGGGGVAQWAEGTGPDQDPVNAANAYSQPSITTLDLAVGDVVVIEASFWVNSSTLGQGIYFRPLLNGVYAPTGGDNRHGYRGSTTGISFFAQATWIVQSPVAGTIDIGLNIQEWYSSTNAVSSVNMRATVVNEAGPTGPQGPQGPAGGSAGGPALMLLSGRYTYDGTSSTGYGSQVSFSKHFASPPEMTATVLEGTAGSEKGYYVKIITNNAANFRFRHYKTDGFWGDSVAGDVLWQAIGEPLDPADANVGTGPEGLKGDDGDMTEAATDERVRRVGFNAGSTGGVDWNDYTVPGTGNELLSNSLLNSPPGTSSYYYNTVYSFGSAVDGSTNCTQVATPYKIDNGVYNGAMFIRTFYNGNWSDWNEIGVTTTGSNSNGYYQKHSDGTMVCWHTWTAAVAIESTYGPLFINGTASDWDFPQTFIAAPTVTVGKGQWGTGASWATCYSSGTTRAQLRVFDIVSRAATTTTAFMATAHGRWKA